MNGIISREKMKRLWRVKVKVIGERKSKGKRSGGWMDRWMDSLPLPLSVEPTHPLLVRMMMTGLCQLLGRWIIKGSGRDQDTSERSVSN